MNRDERDDGIRHLADLIASASIIVPFTGAGISTECGIPDFRSPGGVWTRNRPVPFDEFKSCLTARTQAWHNRFAMDDVFGRARPGRGHRAIAALYRAGKIPAVPGRKCIAARARGFQTRVDFKLGQIHAIPKMPQMHRIRRP